MDSLEAGPSAHDLIPPPTQMQGSDVFDREAPQVDYISEWYTHLSTTLDEKSKEDLEIPLTLQRLNVLRERITAWPAMNFDPFDQDEIGRRIWNILGSMKAIQAKLAGTDDRRVAPDGSLDIQSLRKISQYMIKDALDDYAKQSRTPANVTAVVLASYAHYESVDHNPVNRAFMTSYVGDAVQDLNKFLKDLYIPINDLPVRTRYAPVVALLQSSGSGKSRTAIQLSNSQVGLYLCVRHTPSDGQLVSAPPQDKAAYDSLVPTDPQEGPDEAKVAVSTWLTAFATVFADFIQGQPRDEQNWSAFAQTVAIRLLSDVVETFGRKATSNHARTPPAEGESIISGQPTAPSKLPGLLSPRAVLLRDISSAAKTARLEHAQYVERSTSQNFDSSLEAPAADRLRSSLHEALDRLQKLVPDGCYAHLTIDEAVSMGSLRLTELRRCLSHIVFPRFRVLLLDTSNKVTELTGLNVTPDPQAESFRIRKGDLFLAPPFTRLPHDVFLWYDQKEASRYAGILTGTEPVSF